MKIFESFKSVITESHKKTYNMIGFAKKYYTLWEVTEEDKYIQYEYKQNLSYDLDSAREKAKTDLFNENLKGRTKSFVTVKYSNGEEQEFEVGDKISLTDYSLDFGKYKGQNIIDVADSDPLYLAWVVDTFRHKKPKLVTFISSLLPVKDILENDPKYKERTARLNQLELQFKDQVELAITNVENDILKNYGLKLTLSQSKRNPKSLVSNTFTITTDFKTLYPNKTDRVAKLRNKRAKNFARDIQLNNNRLTLILKLDPLHDLSLIKIDNKTPEELGSTPRLNMTGNVAYYIPDYNNSDLKNVKCELTGNIAIDVHEAIEHIDYIYSHSYTFNVKKVNIL